MIVGPGILATAVSTGVAIVFCKVVDYKNPPSGFSECSIDRYKNGYTCGIVDT